VPKYLDKETVHDPDFDPDMLTDDGSYTLCGVVMQLTMILKTRAADWAILHLMTSIQWKIRDFGDYY